MIIEFEFLSNSEERTKTEFDSNSKSLEIMNSGYDLKKCGQFLEDAQRRGGLQLAFNFYKSWE
jgi:hypothetical protein